MAKAGTENYEIKSAFKRMLNYVYHLSHKKKILINFLKICLVNKYCKKCVFAGDWTYQKRMFPKICKILLYKESIKYNFVSCQINPFFS